MIQPNSSSSSPEGQPGSSLVPAQTEISAEYHLNLGKTLYQSYLARSRQQDLDEAVRHFQKAVEMEPELAEAYVQLASALWDQGAINLELAQFYCETALKLDPTQAEAHLFLGYFLQRAGLLDDAREEYTMAIRKNFLRSGRPRIALGNTLLKQSLQSSKKGQQVGLAVQGTWQFIAGCALLPFDKQAFSLLQDALLTDAKIYTLDSMAKALKGLNMHKTARSVYKLGIKLMPKESQFYQIIGDEYLFDEEKPQLAIPYYHRALNLEPQNLGLMKKLAKAYVENDDAQNAIQILQAALEINGNDFDMLYQMAQIYTDEQAYIRALYYYKEAERQRPSYPYVHSNMAYVLFKMEDIEGAYEEYKIALDYGTDPIWLSSVAQTLGTITYQINKNANEAIDYFQQSMQFNPENKDSMLMLADLYFETGDMEMAISAYKTLLQMDPGNADCYSNIGYILWQMDQNDAAIEAYLTALQHDPDNYVAQNNLGVIYLDEEACPEKSLSMFETALQLKPDYTLACFNIGRAYAGMGCTLEAAEFYSKALRLNQRNPELEDQEIQDYIDRLFQ